MKMHTLDQRIGKLNNGKFYAFTKGYKAKEVIGSLEEVEIALGLRAKQKPLKYWDVTAREQFPSYGDDGQVYRGIEARSKKEACERARDLWRFDGNSGIGCGLVWFKAEEGEAIESDE
jgi:hypothetical protein